ARPPAQSLALFLKLLHQVARRSFGILLHPARAVTGFAGPSGVSFAGVVTPRRRRRRNNIAIARQRELHSVADRKSTRLNSSHSLSLHDALPICPATRAVIGPVPEASSPGRSPILWHPSPPCPRRHRVCRSQWCFLRRRCHSPAQATAE